MNIKCSGNTPEDVVAEKFSVAVETSSFGGSTKDVKRLVITRGNRSESLRLNAEEAQKVMITLSHEFPGLFSQLVQAAGPFTELLEDDYQAGEMFDLEVDGGDVTKLKQAMRSIEEVAFNHLNLHGSQA